MANSDEPQALPSTPEVALGSSADIKEEDTEVVDYIRRVLNGQEKSWRYGGRSGVKRMSEVFDMDQFARMIQSSHDRDDDELCKLFAYPVLHELALSKLKHFGTWQTIGQGFANQEDMKKAIQEKNTVAFAALYGFFGEAERKAFDAHARDLLLAFYNDDSDNGMTNGNTAIRVQEVFWRADEWFPTETGMDMNDLSFVEREFLNYGLYQEEFISKRDLRKSFGIRAGQREEDDSNESNDSDGSDST